MEATNSSIIGRVFSSARVAYGKLLQSTRDFLFGTVEEAQRNRDPIMELVVQTPVEMVWFIKLVMLFGALTGCLVSLPCLLYLACFWEDCQCNLYLRGWMAVFSALQLSQVPIRYNFFLVLHLTPNEREVIIRRVHMLTSSGGWKASKLVSIINYGWFVLGIIWVFNAEGCEDAPGLWRLTVAVIVISLLRLLITFVCFWIWFPPDPLGTPPPHDKGASRHAISKIPLVRLDKAAEMDNPEKLNCLDGSVSSDTCSICLEEFETGDMLRVLSCVHRFHQACVDKWLLKNKQCPLCLRCIDEAFTDETAKDQ